MILHLLPAWLSETMGADDDYLPAAFAADGFIHCSPADDVMLAVANGYYAAATRTWWCGTSTRRR